ncbi:MAG: hypothetical protein K8U57_37800 [Planctomycetes bacterium]|nr:hypothetical protein [Planctomycetota bacterium]
MSNLRRRLEAALDAVEEITAANRVEDGRSEKTRWIAILRMMVQACPEAGQSPEGIVALGRIRRTLAMLEPVEHETGFVYLESACQGARYQLSWPGHPATWDDAGYESRIESALQIDQGKRLPPIDLDTALAKAA